MSHTTHGPLPQKAIVTLSDDDLGGGLSGLRWRLHGLVMDGACLVVIDVSEVDQISSTLLAASLTGAPRIRKAGRFAG